MQKIWPCCASKSEAYHCLDMLLRVYWVIDAVHLLPLETFGTDKEPLARQSWQYQGSLSLLPTSSPGICYDFVFQKHLSRAPCRWAACNRLDWDGWDGQNVRHAILPGRLAEVSGTNWQRVWRQLEPAPFTSRINVCDLPEKFDQLQAELHGKYSSITHVACLHAYCLTWIVSDVPGIKVLKDGHHVSRASDFIIYSVEAEFIRRVVAEYGPCPSPRAYLFALRNNL